MATCFKIFKHLELSAVPRKTTPFPNSILVFDKGDFSRFAKESLPTEIGKGGQPKGLFFDERTLSNN